MDRRLARLETEYQELMAINSRSDLVKIEAREGSPPKRYRISFKCKGIMLEAESLEPCITAHHVMEIYLSSKYPSERPERRWLTPIFHPNIDKNGNVCLGDDWAPSMTLSWLVEQLADYVTYRAYNTDNPNNKEAAAWALQHLDLFPIDERPLFRDGVETAGNHSKYVLTEKPIEVRLGKDDVTHTVIPSKASKPAEKKGRDSVSHGNAKQTQKKRESKKIDK
jgi:ubiquitin-protein ligase